MPRSLRILTLVALALAPGLPVWAAPPAVDRKGLDALAVAWAKARPKSKFDAWDAKARAEILEKAKALGPIPEGALEEVRDILWRALRKEWPRTDGKMTTPYGEAKWIQNGKGGPKAGLVLGLHGGGEGAGDASEAAGKWRLSGCLHMYPQGIKLVHDTWNTVHGERFVLTLMENAKVQHEVDPDRVYTMGFSMGGTGSWFFAGRHPDLLAGSAPCAGVLMASPKSQVATKAEVKELQYGFVPNVRNLAMYWFIGLADKNCMPGTFQSAWDQILELRKADPSGYLQQEFATYEGLAHAFPPSEPSKLLTWIATKRRDALPKKIVWEVAVSPYPLPEDDTDRKVARYVKEDFYWLHYDRPADRAYTTASIDGNTIALSLSTGFPEDWTIWLKPKMVDVTKEVVVTVDGKEAYRGLPVPDVLTVLETLDARVDRTLTFDRRIRLAKN